MKRFVAHLGALLLSAVLLALGAHGSMATDQYPTRTVKILVPYAPGGATDITARIVADQMQKITGQSFVVINKPGAFGLLAIDELVKSAPDGYTLMVGNVSTNAITPILYRKKMTYDYRKSVAAVSNLIEVPAFLLVSTANGFPVKTVAELIAYAKKNPGKLRYGTVGVGSYPEYDMAYFAKRAGNLDMSALPNKNGATGVVQDMLRGDVHAAFLNVASTAGMVQAGKFRAIAVVNDKRLPEYPDIPTMKEAGFSDVGTVAWNGLFAPAATPKPVLAALNAIVLKAMENSGGEGKIRQAENDDLAKQVGRRRPRLAHRADQALAQHHRPGRYRREAVTDAAVAPKRRSALRGPSTGRGGPQFRPSDARQPGVSITAKPATPARCARARPACRAPRPWAAPTQSHSLPPAAPPSCRPRRCLWYRAGWCGRRCHDAQPSSSGSDRHAAWRSP